jgi:alpha-tubulin suppressor-like RCC1 family protein
MGSILLTGGDFVSNTNDFQVADDGAIVVDSVRSNDYSAAIVSRDAFDFTTGNKSVRFVFTASPYVTAARRGIFGAGASGKFAAVVDNGDSVEWKGDTFSSSCPGTPNCEGLSARECASYYSVGISSTHTVVKSGACIGTAGDNSKGQLDIDSPDTVAQVSAGNGFTVIMRNDGVVTLLGNNSDDSLSVPASMTSFTENDMPISISAGEEFFATLFRNGTVEVVGSSRDSMVDLDGKVAVSISAGNQSVAIMTMDGTVFEYTVSGDQSELNEIMTGCLKISSAADRIAMLCEDGKVRVVGSDISGVREVGSIPSGSQVIDVIAGESFTLCVLKDRTVVVDEAAPDYLSDISAEKIGGPASVSEIDDAYDMFPMLRDITGINVMAGVQNDQLDSSYLLYTSISGETKPIISGRTGYNSIFTGIRGAFKGAILAKTDNGGDMCFDIVGSEYNPYTATGHLPISTNFITDNEDEKYEIIVTFSPFGKIIKFRKSSGEYWQEMPFKHISLEETGFSAGRVALYIRNVKDFRMEFAEVTDELDASLLPPEIVYRDIDTAVLHTKAAEMVIDLADAVETIGDSAKLTSQFVRALNADYKEKIQDILDRLTALEE